VLTAFRRAYGSEAPVCGASNSAAAGRADIRAAVRLTLLRAGVPAENIDTCELCTHRDGAEFYSHRRERGVTGRMAAEIAARA
jgi:copper oxidase (laccase) domain-containing protein